MQGTQPNLPSRRYILAGVLSAAPLVARAFSPLSGHAVRGGLETCALRGAIITILGDSITAGYGLAANASLPVQLQTALAKRGVIAQVRGAGVSGDTTAGGLARLDFSVQADTRLCIVALGGNDLLQGLDPRITAKNLQKILQRLKARRVSVVLAGLTAPPVIGRSYAHDFDAVFATVARHEGVRLYANLLAGVAGHTALLQHDGLHPNAAGATVIAERLAPVVVAALERH